MPKYQHLITEIGILLQEGRQQAYQYVNNILVKTYWEIGRRIVEYETSSGEGAGYGSKLFEKIVLDLKARYGKGFSRCNIIYMRLLFQKYPKSQTLSDQLTWSHYIELLAIDDELERNFYEKQCLLEKWSFRELKRQKNSALFQRLALSKNKEAILKLSQQGQLIEKPTDLIKEPYVLEFLDLPEKHTEKELEQKIIDHLQQFLLEFGKGLTFVARQFRISLSNKHFYIDLVFYHRILKCFVLIDLKVGEVNHQDVGQMNLYLNYFKKEENRENDNGPIGLILGTKKDKIVIEYALGGISNNLFVSKYKLYLPQKKELEEKIRKILKKEVGENVE